ncbi:Uncharacterised protein [Actinobacillus pleuropneumoniae]|nr:Uncharacterised protein [Actinobacillus pleuropneumoniae]
MNGIVFRSGAANLPVRFHIPANMHPIVNDRRVIELQMAYFAGQSIDNRDASFRIRCGLRAGLAFIRRQDITAIGRVLDHIRLNAGFIRSDQAADIVEHEDLAGFRMILLLNGNHDLLRLRVDIDAGQVSIQETARARQILYMDLLVLNQAAIGAYRHDFETGRLGRPVNQIELAVIFVVFYNLRYAAILVGSTYGIMSDHLHGQLVGHRCGTLAQYLQFDNRLGRSR